MAKKVDGFMVLQDVFGAVHAVGSLTQYEQSIAQKKETSIGEDLTRLVLFCIAGYQVIKTIDDFCVWAFSHE